MSTEFKTIPKSNFEFKSIDDIFIHRFIFNTYNKIEWKLNN